MVFIIILDSDSSKVPLDAAITRNSRVRHVLTHKLPQSFHELHTFLGF